LIQRGELLSSTFLSFKMTGPIILVDTREQEPLWEKGEPGISFKKLQVCDYTTPFLLGKAHAERKSPNDLYSSIIGDHERFKRMIKRAVKLDIKIAVFVECPERQFYGKRFKFGWKLKVKGNQLAKTIKTMKSRYNLDFYWCKDRQDMKDKIVDWFIEYGKIARSQEAQREYT